MGRVREEIKKAEEISYVKNWRERIQSCARVKVAIKRILRKNGYNNEEAEEMAKKYFDLVFSGELI